MVINGSVRSIHCQTTFLALILGGKIKLAKNIKIQIKKNHSKKFFFLLTL